MAEDVAFDTSAIVTLTGDEPGANPEFLALTPS